ncbi:hypothetical protein K7I13_04100 [Brucepastera parasyntrophica]|uniref:hypothetical protein n=1 Tax=Brucepastera parasyntrophica TaxID=2880008 RepID=UPI002108C4F4|nr:hypothetical protein [Brucepastera parasyntrophica]ULQ60496.1 hypothetical protein K7I13_04100 [Brucepastera parasyntrophica]
MKRRCPGFVYISMFLTGGIYLFYWLFCQIEEINRYRKTEVIKYKRTIVQFVSVFSVFVILFTAIFYQDPFHDNTLSGVAYFFCCILAVYWIILIIVTVRRIGAEVKKIQKEKGITRELDLVTLVVLFFIYLSAPAYLQSNINKIIDLENPREKNSKKPLLVSLFF